MTLIEGIGDELTITITILVLLVTLVAAWASTQVTTNRLTLTQTQLSGLRVELNELTSDDHESDEEAGSSTESTEVEQLAEVPTVTDHQSPQTVIAPSSGLHGPGAAGNAVGVEDLGAVGGVESLKQSPAKSSKTDASHVTATDDDKVNKDSSTASAPYDCSSTAAASGPDEDKNNFSTSRSERNNSEDNPIPQSSQRTNVDATDNDVPSQGDISLKIKFLNETERIVRTRTEETVGNFKRLNFAEESRGGRVVHLIFNGQFLRDDSRQLGSYSVVDNCVLHCHISQHQRSPGTGPEQPDQADIDLGQFMVPLFACTIGFVWYLRWQYSYMFNTMSTMSLSAVTVLFMLAVLAAWRG